MEEFKIFANASFLINDKGTNAHISIAGFLKFFSTKLNIEPI